MDTDCEWTWGNFKDDRRVLKLDCGKGYTTG